MKPKNHKTVYVIGAGFSAGLGYPLTKSLLIESWEKLEPPAKDQLRRIIKFHHPGFEPEHRTSFPDIEQLLTEISVNLELFKASRSAVGKFTKDDLENSREALLSAIAQWFHEIFQNANGTLWLSKLTKRFKTEQAAIVSFNWDLILDHQLFGDVVRPRNYGLDSELGPGPSLLKPHGSLNWYELKQLSKVSPRKHVCIFDSKKESEQVGAFLLPRGIKSKAGNRYTPLIVPPTFLKDFRRPIFQTIWRRCTSLLSTADEITFLGYSLPAADLQAQFIFRCGFHNQIDGVLNDHGSRRTPSGPAKVTIVNPDQGAACRIESVVGPKIPCIWLPQTVQQWAEEVVS